MTALFFCCGNSLQHTYQPSANENSGHDKTVLEITQSYSTPRLTSQYESSKLEKNHLQGNPNRGTFSEVTLDVFQEKDSYFLNFNEAYQFSTKQSSHIKSSSPEMNKKHIDRSDIYKIEQVVSDDNKDELREVLGRHRLSSEEAISISTTMTTNEMESPNIFPYMNRMKKATGIQLPSSESGLTGIANYLQRIEKTSEAVALCTTIPLIGLPTNIINENKIMMVLVYSEVMQLKGSPREAVPVLQNTITQLTAYNNDWNSNSYNNNNPNNSNSSNSRVTIAVSHLAALHRRLSSVLKSAGDYVQSERHIRLHLSLIEIILSCAPPPPNNHHHHHKSMVMEKGLSLTLLSSILDKLGQVNEAIMVDQEALTIILSVIQHESLQQH